MAVGGPPLSSSGAGYGPPMEQEGQNPYHHPGGGVTDGGLVKVPGRA